MPGAMPNEDPAAAAGARPEASTAALRYDGRDARELAALLGVPRVELLASVGSTMDTAHILAAGADGRDGAPPGTVVLAEEQRAGRGRAGRRWSSAPGAGIWLTLIERPADAEALQVLSIRLGLRAARVLDRYAAGSVSLKWPNDMFVGGGKLAGILVEARWRGGDRPAAGPAGTGRPEWVAIGIGLNVVPPNDLPAAGLEPGTSRVEVLSELVPALRAAAFARGLLGADELAAWRARDLAAGRRCLEPAAGVVRGIAADGALVVAGEGGDDTFRGGSLVLAEEA
jgi:BirA family biotin operon repressor/biotin-[acetyl-CoA-carboxylase] ligase